MRSNFQSQPELSIVPIEKIHIPTNSRDQLAPTLLALQKIHSTPEIINQIYSILEAKILPGKSNDKGRPGLTHWQILVLGIVRNARNCDYDQLEDLATHHSLIRQFLCLPAIAGGDLTNTPDLTYNTIRNNVCHITEEILQEINKIIAQYGHNILSKKKDVPDKIIAKTDTYVLETNVHFPTDINLLWDAARKIIALILSLTIDYNIPGWRKHKSIRAELKSQMRILGNINQKGGKNKQQRLENAARFYLNLAAQLQTKTIAAIEQLKSLPLTLVEQARLKEIEYFYEMLEKHIDLIERRIIKGETIPHEEKLFSLFEPHTQWINKGKAGTPVELGRKLLITTDQNHIILDYKILDTPDEHPQACATIARILEQYGQGSIASISFDKGFSSAANKLAITGQVDQLIMPKKGKRNLAETAEEHEPIYINLRHAHSAIESNINSLEQHGLDRSRDKGLHGYSRCVGLGVLAYNLHRIGDGLLRREKAAEDKEAKKVAKKLIRANKRAA